MKTIFIKLLILIGFSLFLFGCAEDDEAKKLGFNSSSEMKEIQAKGWHTKHRYEEDRAKAAGFASAAEMKVAEEATRQEAALEQAKALAEKVRVEDEAKAEVKKKEAKSILVKGTIYAIPFSKVTGKCLDNTTCIDSVMYESLCKKATGFTKLGFRTSADKYIGMGDFLASNGTATSNSIEWSQKNSECIARLTLEGIYKGNSVRWNSIAVVEEFLFNEEGHVMVHRADFKYNQ